MEGLTAEHDGIYLGSDYAHPFDVPFVNQGFRGGDLSLTCSNGPQTVHYERFKIGKTSTPTPQPTPVDKKVNCDEVSNYSNFCVQKRKTTENLLK